MFLHYFPVYFTICLMSVICRVNYAKVMIKAIIPAAIDKILIVHIHGYLDFKLRVIRLR